jgi:hypothetical protein
MFLVAVGGLRVAATLMSTSVFGSRVDLDAWNHV